MNKGGRPRIPTALKEKKGTKQNTRERRPLTLSKVVQLEALPEAPEWLGEEGKRQWRVLTEQIDRMGIAAKVDTLALASACHEWERYVAMRRETAAHSPYYAIKGDDGEVKSWQPHPAHYIGNDHLKNFMAIAAQFGFTPSARMKLAIAPPVAKEESPVARLLKKTA